MNEELPAAVKVGSWGKDPTGEYDITRPVWEEYGRIECEVGDELVRRSDVVDLIDEKLDAIYEEENNASADQEIATAEMLMKLLKEVKN